MRVACACLVAVALGWAGASAAEAQTRRAQLHLIVSELRDVIASMPRPARPADFDSLLDGPLERLRVTETRLPLAAIGRIRDPRMTEGMRDETLRSDVRWVTEIWNQGGLADSARNHLGDTRFARLDTTIERYLDADMLAAAGRLDQWLHGFDVKYGEGAPRLNLAEVLLNGFAQRWSPFQSNDAGPSRNELLLGYTTTWATLADDEAKAVSTLETGWRRYNFGWHAGGHGDWTGILRPRYWALGVLVAPPRDGALRWPLEGVSRQETRAGPFVTWGDLKAAVLLGPESRFIFSRQLQLLPGLF